ncbi:hypothetical protein Tco_0897952 [Tanacetum coccineum]
MSDSEDSMVTHTVVSSPFRGLLDIGSLGVDGPPVMLKDPYAYVVASFQASPSLDYVPGPEYPPSPDFVLESVYPEFMPPEDEVLPAEEQPLYAAVSPTAHSPGYVPMSDPEEDSEEDDDEDPEEDPADYPIDGGDDGDDDEDDDVDIEGDEEEEEYPAPETEPFETDESAAIPPPHPAYRITARISIRDERPIPFWPDTEIPSPPLPVSPPPASPTYPLGYRAAMIQLRDEASSTSHLPPPHIILSHTKADTPPSGTPPLLPIPLPTSSPPLHLLSTNRRADKPKVTLLPRKRLGIALGMRYEVGESSSAPTARPPKGFRADYGFVASSNFSVSYFGFSNTVMSDSEDSMVTHTAVSSPFRGLLDIGSLGVDGPPVMLKDPYAYVVASFQASPSLDYVPVSPPPASPTYPLGYRAAMIQLRDEASSTSHLPPPHIILSHTKADTPPSGTPPLLPIPLPTSSPSLHLLSTNRRADKPKVTLLPRKRLGIALGMRYEVGESSSAPTARPPKGFREDYGFDEMLVDMSGAPATDDTELGRRMTKFTTRVRQDTDEIYTRLDDEQTEQQLMAGRLNMLYIDRRAHARTTRLMKAVARMSREAWGRSMDASDLARVEVMSLCTTVLGQQAIQMIKFKRQQGPAKGPAQPDAPEEAGRSS